jgi:exodeoxyribonuclease VII large subunit
MPQPTDSATQQSLTVSQLTAQIKDLVEGGFPSVWVSGEVSNFSRPQSGHMYFTLKDDQAQIRAVMWRGTATRAKFELADGLEVICHGHLDVYAPRGSYQLVVDQLQPKGVGALELALRKLREKLAAEGLFDPARKRPLPAFPRRLAFVTSAGAVSTC